MEDKELQSLVFSAVQHHNDSLLSDLLDGENATDLLDMPNEEGNMLLHVAVIENAHNCIECLLQRGANPNVFDANRARSPLHLAVELGHAEIVKMFLQLDYINLNLRDDRNLTCYEIAQFCDNQNLADIINNRREEIEKLKDDFYSAMNQACSSNNPKVVKELLEEYSRRTVDNLPPSWRPRKDCNQFVNSYLKELINWSSSSWNDVTLLFKSASKGHTEICRLLIEFGANAKCNENTNYSPLYVAAYGGFTETVRLLLENFPYLVKEITIERWTVLHACCLQGHSDTAKLLLNYPYPDSLKQRFVSRSSSYEYNFAFNLNAQDAAGQTVIYLAVSANNENLLDTLLQFNVDARVLDTPVQQTQTVPKPINESSKQSKGIATSRATTATNFVSKQRNKVSSQNDQFNTTLNLFKKFELRYDQQTLSSPLLQDDNKYLICPFDLDTYCDYNSKTALHLAVCQQSHRLATTLLVNGANPNLPVLSRDSIKNDFSTSNSDVGLNWLRSSKSTCLKEACRMNDETMCEILIRYGASDNQDNLALQVATLYENNRLISMFLSLKSNIDSEYKINRKCNVEFSSRYKQGKNLPLTTQGGSNTTTFSSMFPTNPVAIDWQNLKCLKQIEPQWLIESSLLHNKRLRHPTNSLMAITRLDLSSNNLKSIHPVIFRLPSLRELNLANNRLESLLDFHQVDSHEAAISTSKLIESHRTAMKRSKSSCLSSVNLEKSNIIDLNEPQDWDLPCLETLDLHDNLLISLPDCLFELPRLSELDVSSNQLRQLPWVMWTAPSLKEFIASSNLLDDLPKTPPQTVQSPQANAACRLSQIPELPKDDQANSLTSNQSCELSFASSSESAVTASEPDYLKKLNPNHIGETQLTNHIGIPVHVNLWQDKVNLVDDASVESSRDIAEESANNQEDRITASKITYLNLSHNSFTSIPPVLACMAVELVRLNLSHNQFDTLGDISLYPSKLKNLDLSYNQINSWFQFSQIEDDTKHCYNEHCRRSSLKFSQRGSLNCPHKMHQRLDNLKSINLNHNLLETIQISQPVEVNSINRSRSPRGVQTSSPQAREQLLYSNVTAIDLSYNKLQRVPENLSTLKDLSVLNLNSNTSISTLPAELGLASKLWNLGVQNCNLSEPLKSIVESTSYKTMDMIGYLRSILEESKPYARMKLMLVGLQGIGKTSLLEQMRLEGSTGPRKRAPEHWTKRMGHASRSNLRNQKGVTLSTVGVDIHNWIFCKRTPRNQHNFGPVSFSTWDFGGQEEFYATHRYFLSKRSLYLVVWRLTDGLDGILGIQQWLVNIQSRAPNSPVIIVGTHEDMIDGGEKGERISKLQAEVFGRFINMSDQDKCGLPRIMDSIVVSTKTKLNIKNLCNRIYDVVFSLRSQGSMERLLEQKIPATYLALEEIVSSIANERHQKKREPVLTYTEFSKIASEQLKIRYNKVFRDLEPIGSREVNYNSELQQATRFLHENGVLLHYEDANLRDLYFLDPQWLCDILSHVVTIREINPHIKNGLMKIDDLGSLFKSMEINLSGGIQSYVISLLNKFEIALTWNSQYLLIPPLLPENPDSINLNDDVQIKVAPRTRGRSTARRFEGGKISATTRATSIDPTSSRTQSTTSPSSKYLFEFEYQHERSMTRLVFLRYLPAGFLARLQSGILSDFAFDDICDELHANIVDSMNEDLEPNELPGSRAGWLCWKRGIRLSLQKESTINTRERSEQLAPCLLSIQEFCSTAKDFELNSFNFAIECIQVGPRGSNNAVEGTATIPTKNIEIVGSKWQPFDVNQYSNAIAIVVPSISFKAINKEDRSVKSFELDHLNTSRLLSKAVDHIDNLLEDWYPSLGTRFAHTLGGNYLVTRIVPCQNCAKILPQEFTSKRTANFRTSRFDSRHARLNDRVKFSISSAADNNPVRVGRRPHNLASSLTIHCFYVEHCILNAYNLTQSPMGRSNAPRLSLSSSSNSSKNKRTKARNMNCPAHGTLQLNSIAPDVLFEDIADESKIDCEQIERCKLIGRGTLGFVFKGSLQSTFPLNQLGQGNQEVALKLLQPVEPGPEAEQTDIVAYESAQSSWLREPFQAACKSYCTARHELNILRVLSHPNIVSLIGLCLRPLAIVLELAPLGSLKDVFKNYKRAGVRIDQFSAQKAVLQVARALEFLHQQRVIYRDLKTENVLVWSFPSPYATQLLTASINLKLADYGISRQALSTGICKGFAGTILYLAPEILRHNGDEEYTEKVDCFSFGMFVYELLTLRPPYAHGDSVRGYLADGGRPNLISRDLTYPSYMLDLMSSCWSQEPHHRPTASQIVSVASSPEFMQILDAVSLKSNGQVDFCGAIRHRSGIDLWFGDSVQLKVVSSCQGRWTDCNTFEASQQSGDPSDFGGAKITAMCLVGRNTIWFCDSHLNVHTLPAISRKVNLDERCLESKLGSTLDVAEQVRPENTIKSFPLNSSRNFDLKTPIRTILYVECANSVVLLSFDGLLWLYMLSTMNCVQLQDGSVQFNCIALPKEEESRTKKDAACDSFHLFCGQANGISLMQVRDGEVCRQSILPLVGLKTMDTSSDEQVLDPSQSTQVTSIVASEDLLWTSAGCTIHMWNIDQKRIVRKLDCWKLVPCSESLESINIEQYYAQARSSTISSLVFLNDELYVGTSHGCFITVEAKSLKPLTIFRPYERDILVLNPSNCFKQTSDDDDNDDSSNWLVTLGVGYRDLLGRYVSCLEDSSSGLETVAILLAADKYNL